MRMLPGSNQRLLFALLALLVAGCSDGEPSGDVDGGEPLDATLGADAGTGGGDPDAGDSVDASTGADSGTLDAGSGGPDAGEPTCADLPACEASKGCGPTLTEPCCCDDSVFIPQPGLDCCCGYGIAPGANLMCSGAGEG